MSFTFDIQCQGITCSGCGNKIQKNLQSFESIKNISINVFAQKVLVTLGLKEDIDKVVEKIKEIGFQVLGTPVEQEQNSSASIRRVSFQFLDPALSPDVKKNIQDSIKNTIFGVEKTEFTSTNLLHVSYDQVLTKGRIIFDHLEKQSSAFEVFDIHLDNLKRKNFSVGIGLKDLILSLTIVIFYVLFAMIFPLFDWFKEPSVYPQEWSIFSVYYLVMLAFTIFTVLLYGIPMYKSAFVNFKKEGTIPIEFLITLASIGSIIMSIYLTIVYAIQISKETVFNLENRVEQLEMIVSMMETSGFILAIENVGKYFEGTAKQSVVKMTDDLFPQDELIKNSTLKYVEAKNQKLALQNQKQYEVSLLEKGDLIQVQGPMKLLLDSVVIQQNNLILIDSVSHGQDDSFSPQVGERINSGAFLKEGTAILQIEKTIENSMLVSIAKQLNVAQNSTDSSSYGIQTVFKKISEHFVKIIITIATLVTIIWYILIGTNTVVLDENQFCKWCYPLERGFTILVASCPCSLGLAIPTVLVILLNIAMKNSLLIKKNSVLEKINTVGGVVFDKTGTLFTKVKEIRDFEITEKTFTEQQLWEIIMHVEKESNHPIAELLYKESLNRKNLLQSENVFQLQDKVNFHKTGLEATLIHTSDSKQELQVLIGNKFHYEKQTKKSLSSTIHQKMVENQKLGKTSLLLSVNYSVQMIIYLDNTANLRPEAKAVITYLQEVEKKDVFILSGDSVDTVAKVGDYLKIPRENLIGEIDAESKMRFLQTLKQKKNYDLMMIGDGLNDILSLQEAGIGVSINAKSELNLVASDVVALNENLWKIPTLFHLIKTARIFIAINIFWVFAYNLFIIPVSAGAFYAYNFTISPIIASTAMSLSAVVVVLLSNIMRLINFDPSNEKKWGQFVDKQRILDDKKAKNNTIQQNLNEFVIDLNLMNSSCNTMKVADSSAVVNNNGDNKNVQSECCQSQQKIDEECCSQQLEKESCCSNRNIQTLNQVSNKIVVKTQCEKTENQTCQINKDCQQPIQDSCCSKDKVSQKCPEQIQNNKEICLEIKNNDNKQQSCCKKGEKNNNQDACESENINKVDNNNNQKNQLDQNNQLDQISLEIDEDVIINTVSHSNNHSSKISKLANEIRI